MKRVLLIALIAALFGCCGVLPSDTSETTSSLGTSSSNWQYETGSYENPVRFYKQDGSEYSVYCADPDILRCDEDGYFYMYCTNTECEMGDMGIAYDLGPIFRSENLTDWIWVGSVFRNAQDAAEWGTAGAGVWAPSVIRVGNRYNYYYSLSAWNDPNPGIGMATSPTPYGPWTHYGRVLDQNISGVRNGIDPQAIYIGEQLYLVWGSFFGIACIELTDDGLEPFHGTENLKEHVRYLIADNSGGEMDVDVNYEGSYIVCIDGTYYYFGSQGTCLSGTSSTYRVKVGKSDSFFGPYTGSDGKDLADREGSFGDTVVAPDDRVVGTGHNTVVQDFAGAYWIFFHGYDLTGDHPLDRIPFLEELLWEETTGMPSVRNFSASVGERREGPTTVRHE